jgi:PD-(D/E)XK nuclease superfamily
MTALQIAPPAGRLPVEYLSLSSLKLFMQCPTKWRRKYVDNDPEPASGKMILGSAAGAALAQHFGRQIESGTGLATADVLDEFCAEWENRIGREEVIWGNDSPGALKDSGAGALKAYHLLIVPEITPVAVEREFQLSWPDVPWKITGYIDLEDADGRVRDYKMTAKRMSQKDADADLQATIYFAARRAEGNPATGFLFDTMVRNKQPVAESVRTERSERQLDHLATRIFTLVREIEWRCETDTWSGAAPNTWFCGTCQYHDCEWRLG